MIKPSLQWIASKSLYLRAFNVEANLSVLMYHRILPEHDPRYATEEPGMVVEPETFKQHLQQIKQLFTPVHLSEWTDRKKKGLPLPRKACAITFDDGWADNYEYALPIIEAEQVPITLFAVSDMIGTQRQFWPNQINDLLNYQNYQQLQQLEWLRPHLPPKAIISRDSISHIINSLKQYSDEYIYQQLSTYSLASSPATSINNNTLMSWAQLKTMSQSNLVEIGSHTCNHYRLNPSLNQDQLSHEIIQSKHRLQDGLSQDINLFCYPNGDVSPEAIQLVSEHYQAAVTTQRGINTASKCQLHTLQRLGIHQDISHSPTAFRARLANWF